MRGAVSFLLLTVVAAAVAELEQNEVRELIMKLLADKRDALSMSTSNTVRESEIELVGDAEKRGLSLASCKWNYRTPGIGECSGNGECVNSIRGQNGKYDDYMCKCNDGWKGQKCDTSTSSNTVRESEIELVGDAEKRDGLSLFRCKWDNRAPGIGECSGNGECVNSIRGQNGKYDDYMCKCNDGWQGQKCDTSTSSNTARVIISARELIMELLAGAEKRGLSQLSCEDRYGNCNGHGECVNSMQAQGLYDDYMCRCNTGWKGEECETSTNTVRELLMQLLADAEKRELSERSCVALYANCSGNGQCANSLRGQAGSYDDFICTCNIGWSGQKCDTSV